MGPEEVTVQRKGLPTPLLLLPVCLYLPTSVISWFLLKTGYFYLSPPRSPTPSLHLSHAYMCTH